ncbi:MAG TPA: hypothetical protein VKM94_15980 [Blastocatellia bacterium]|nr:hypothetical protein [Blastocatellia bacterium]
MAKGEKPSNQPSIWEVVAQVVSKIKSEPFLFVIAVIALLVGLTIVPAQIGSSDLRVIVIVSASLAFMTIIGYYVRDALPPRPALHSSARQIRKPTTPPVFEESQRFVDPPVFEESQRFVELPTFSQKKEILIHPFEARIASGTLELNEEQMHKCAASPWDFDRIVLYLQEEKSARRSFNERLQHVTQEWEKLRASEGKRSLIPLHYAIRSILRFLQTAQPPQEAQAIISFFREVSEYLKARPEIDQGGEVKGNLGRVIDILGKPAK